VWKGILKIKIKCKCSKILTEDLRPMKKMGRRPHRYTGNEGKMELFYPKGTFHIQKKDKYSWGYEESGIKGHYSVIHVKERIIVSVESILQNVIPIFKDGYGCCNYSMGHELKCSCGVHVGDMHLDCYEDKVIKFCTKNTIRFYSA
jgi:hypothetical protein